MYVFVVFGTVMFKSTLTHPEKAGLGCKYLIYLNVNSYIIELSVQNLFEPY
jgi:hypothetical protein